MKMQDAVRPLRYALSQGPRLQRALLYALAFVWRRLLLRTTFIAITGSVGKTTAKECLAAILSSRHPIAMTYGSNNTFVQLMQTILQVRPWHRFAVLEVATDGPGWMRRMAPLVHPNVAVILSVAHTHSDKFENLAATAAEKARLLDSLPVGGMAVLNRDDPNVAAMADRGRFRVTWFGGSDSVDVRATHMSSNWPERFSFVLHFKGASHTVKTRLLGTHWASSVLGALAASSVCGASLEEAITALERVEPTTARMQPVVLPGGATMIRDEVNGSVDTLESALQVLEHSKATRRILVFSDVADCSRRPRRRLARIGRRTATVAETAVFVGPRADHGARGAILAGMPADNVHWFLHPVQAAEFLKSELKPQDLVLLKGRGSDHLSRIYFALIGDVGCWKFPCSKKILCDDCDELGARHVVPIGAGNSTLESSDAG
jgi:UDP-N-acetylmuramoyl-tripeptide--D-alanyl-D-alanine ligase